MIFVDVHSVAACHRIGGEARYTWEGLYTRQLLEMKFIHALSAVPTYGPLYYSELGKTVML